MNGAFGGSAIVFLKDNRTVWMYDFLSGGIFEINLDTHVVRTVCFLDEKLGDSCTKIQGMIKKSDELILIPNMINRDWTVIDIKTHSIRYIQGIGVETDILEVRQIGKNVYCLPFNTSMPAVMFGLSSQKNCDYVDVKTLMINGEYDGYVYGSFVDDNKIYFPYVGSKRIGVIEGMYCNVLNIDVPYNIVSVCKNEYLWVLTDAGNEIFGVDSNGNIIESVRIFDGKDYHKSNEFARIIALEKKQFVIVPYNKPEIFVYTGEEKMIKHSLDDADAWGILSDKVNCSFWEYFKEEDGLTLLPYRYNLSKYNINRETFDKIDLVWERENEYSYVEKIKSKEAYIKGIMNEKEKGSLRKYLDLVYLANE